VGARRGAAPCGDEMRKAWFAGATVRGRGPGEKARSASDGRAPRGVRLQDAGAPGEQGPKGRIRSRVFGLNPRGGGSAWGWGGALWGPGQDGSKAGGSNEGAGGVQSAAQRSRRGLTKAGRAWGVGFGCRRRGCAARRQPRPPAAAARPGAAATPATAGLVEGYTAAAPARPQRRAGRGRHSVPGGVLKRGALSVGVPPPTGIAEFGQRPVRGRPGAGADEARGPRLLPGGAAAGPGAAGQAICVWPGCGPAVARPVAGEQGFQEKCGGSAPCEGCPGALIPPCEQISDLRGARLGRQRSGPAWRQRGAAPAAAPRLPGRAAIGGERAWEGGRHTMVAERVWARGARWAPIPRGAGRPAQRGGEGGGPGVLLARVTGRA
jgi:hypothetical protein